MPRKPAVDENAYRPVAGPPWGELSAEDRAFVRECRREREHIVRTGRRRDGSSAVPEKDAVPQRR